MWTGLAYASLVGVDPLGFDVRGRFKIARIPVSTPLPDADAAIATFDRLLEEAE